MKKCKFLSALVAGVVAASMALTGCANNQSSGKGVNAMFPGTAEEGAVTLNFSSEPPSLNSATTTDTISFQILMHVKDGLLMKDQNDIPQPATAEKYEVSDDGLVWTFHLRDDAVWEDGQPVTAQQFKFAWEKVLEPATASEYSYLLYYIKGAKAYNTDKGSVEDLGIECPDDKTLVVTLEAPCAYFDSLVAFATYYPIREDEWSETYGTEANSMHYNGMYVMTEWAHNSKCVFEKNEKYYDAANCKIDKWTGVMINDTSAAINAFKAGELDMVGLSSGDQADELEATYPGVVIDSYSDGSSWCVMMNHKNEMFQNKNIRKAISLCLNREDYVKNVLNDASEPAFHWSLGSLNANGKNFSDIWAENEFTTDNDVEGAKAAWEAGCAELGIPTSTVIEYLTDDNENSRILGEYIQGCAKAAGITLEIKQVPFAERLDNQTNGTYDISMYGWGPDYNDPQTFLELWETGNGNNKAFYSNPDYDAQMEIIHNSTDPEARAKAMVEAEKILAEDYAIAHFYFRNSSYVVSGKLNGMVRTVFQDWSLRWASINK